MALKRRSFIKTAAAVGAMATLPLISCSKTKTRRRVVIVGGGFAGATAAKYISMWSNNIEVIMIERHAQFISCPQSNLVLGGNRTLQQLTHDYDHLSDKYAIKTVHAEVTAIDAEAKKVRLDDGVDIHYDRLILAPGVDFIYDQLSELASAEAQQRIPHAWKAGPQTLNLQQQIRAMPSGGRVLISVPATPFRCPPGPYERASQIAYYLREHNPTAKVLILDENADIASKKALFRSSWQKYYPDLIEHIPNSRIESVNVKTLQVETEFDTFNGDVVNIIPPQKAGKVAEMAGVINIDNRWCEVDFLTYESKVRNDIHIIGDAIHAKLPKSGHMANAQAKVCAAAIVALLNEQLPEQEPLLNNTCYSFIDNNKAGHVAAVYRYNKDSATMIPMPGGGVSAQATELEGTYASAWAKNIWNDVLN